ncbi:MAG: hypothetical protein N4A49_01725 [Marinifilaceae bacterium]|jgi:hypothetical protein|nr:hypothetical protein [Marinifilaceae bacterium]
MGLPVNNLHVSEILSALGISSKKTRDIFYKSNGALRSEYELKQVVKGSLDSSYCDSLPTLRNRRNLASFKSYESSSLACSAYNYTQSYEGIVRDVAMGKQGISVYSSFPFTVSSTHSNLRYIKTNNTVIPYWETSLTGSYDRSAELIIRSNGQEKRIRVSQRRKPYLNGCPSSLTFSPPNVTYKEFILSSNYDISDWDLNYSGSHLSVSISGSKLQISSWQEVDPGDGYTGTIRLELDGIIESISVQVRGDYHPHKP